MPSMSIWSRITESLSAIGGSVMGLLTKLTKGRVTLPEKSIAFTIGLIALGAKMAKADGVVTGEEVLAFKQVFEVPPSELAGVARVFNLAKQDTAGYEAYARQIAKLFNSKAAILEDLLDALFHIAKADDAVHPAELAYLASVAEIFGFSEHDFVRIKARHVASEVSYTVLGLDRNASLDQVKRRYRKLVHEHHPDKHIAAGMPQELIAITTRRLQRINEAYERILRECPA
jgi:DnaJ like chaperone protein